MSYLSANDYVNGSQSWQAKLAAWPASATILAFFILTALLFSIRNQPPAKLFVQHSRMVWGVAYVGLLYPFVQRIGEGFYAVSGDLSVHYKGGDYLLARSNSDASGVGLRGPHVTPGP